jgi:sugar phosphate isomerase/epimerase
MGKQLTRREILGGAAALGAGLAAATAAAAEPAREEARPFLFGLNTSTIRGQKLPLPQEVELAARVGYQAIEPWISELEQFVKDGGALKDLGKRIADAGLRVESAIGFPTWIVDDDAQRAKGFEDARRAMDLVQQIGGKRLAAPPAGATDRPGLDLFRAAERYRALLELGDRLGIVPIVELWGFSKNLSRLSEVAFVAIESRHPKACILADVYHLHKGGSGIAGLGLLNGSALPVLHMNDYPASPGRAEITDAHRVYPGDGVAPLKELLRELRRIGFRGVLSLELFNREYWTQDPVQVARTGLEKMKAVVQASLE